MNGLIRVILILFSFAAAVFSVVFLLMLLNADVLSGMILLLTRMTEQASIRLTMVIFWIAVLVLCVSAMVYGIMTGRLRRTRIRSTEIGSIDIGVDAIESIALNAARSAQGGIKQARAGALPYKGGKLRLVLTTVLYSDVEVPAMMVRVQDRVKKDIERYTGIEVAQVIVRVSRVEAISARIER